MGPKKGSSSFPNKHLHSRASFLYQAAYHVDSAASSSQVSEKLAKAAYSEAADDTLLNTGSSREMVYHLRGVSRKAQIRLSPFIKHTVCKRCDSLLREGSTLRTFLENKSRRGKKPWADMLVHECTQCGFIRRFPIGAQRPPRRPTRVINNDKHSETREQRQEGTERRHPETERPGSSVSKSTHLQSVAQGS